MIKQCHYCGDYFETTVSTRKFCGADCIHRFHGFEPKPKLIPCDLCYSFISERCAVDVWWGDIAYTVCKQCHPHLLERLEASLADYTEIDSTTLVVDEVL